MPPNPQFSYYLYNLNTPVRQENPAWRQPLPLSRHLCGENAGNSISQGDYFLAIRHFLETNDFETVSTALGQCLNKRVKPADITDMRVCLAKHGEFYHPARVEVAAGAQSASFVLNVAVSDAGLRTIHEEYRSLKFLNDEFAHSFIPRVYGYGEIETAGNQKLALFLGDWLEGYHEFHLCADPSGSAVHVRLWGGQMRRSVLSTARQTEIYRQAARILAYYYNVETFEQIFAWHHAAGDFIARVEEDAVDLKLIAVRRYAPLLKQQNALEVGGADVEMMLQTLLLFFLNLSIRMRLDRLDGVGDIVWADPFAVIATLEGFFEGLALKPSIPSLPDAIDRCFAYFLSVSSQEDLGDLCRAVADTFDRRAPETVVVRQNLEAHITSLTRSIQQYLQPS
jgi:hypothetical protein